MPRQAVKTVVESARGSRPVLRVGAYAVVLLLLGQPARASSSIPAIPLIYTSLYSKTETSPRRTSGPKLISTTTNNSISFNSRLPGFGGSNQQLNMMFNQTESKSPGTQTSMSNLNFSLMMGGRNMSYTNGYSLVENKARSGGALISDKANESINVGVNVAWPRMPAFGLMFNSYKADSQTTSSSQMTASYRTGRTSVNFNQSQSAASLPALGEAKSNTASIGVTRQQLNTSKMSLTATVNATRQTAETGGFQNSKGTNAGLSVSLTDNHVSGLPINLNLGFQNAKQLTAQPSAPGVSTTQSSRNANVFTSVSLPGGISTSLSYNTSQSKSQGSTTSKTNLFNVVANRSLWKDTSISYNYTTMTSSGGGQGSRSMSANLSTRAWGDTIFNAQWGKSASPDRSTYMNVSSSSALPGGINLTHQYQTSKANGAKQVSESANMTVPLGRTMQINFSTSKRKAMSKEDASVGFSTSMALSRTTSLSTTFTRQTSDGAGQGKTFAVNLSASLPKRTSLSVGLSIQESNDSKDYSTTVSMTGAL